jgi:putative hemolysin
LVYVSHKKRDTYHLLQHLCCLHTKSYRCGRLFPRLHIGNLATYSGSIFKLDTKTILELLLILALIFINAIFAASEIAILSVRRVRVRQLADEGNSSARALLRLVENPGVFLATIQMGITLTGFFASAVSAVTAVSLVDNLLKGVPTPAIAGNSGALALVSVTILVAFLTLLLGELVPKNLAILQAETIAFAVARPLEMLSIVGRPLVAALTFSTDVVLRLLGVQRVARPTTVTEDELRAMIDLGSKEGVLAPLELEIINGAFDLGEIRARDIMASRLDVVAVSLTATPAQALDLFLRYRYSRLPVYDGTLDNIVGVISAKDMLAAFAPGGEQRKIADLMRPPTIVPETRRASELLTLLQQNNVQLAVVLDEFGGTAGIVTLEDVLEELVGEIAGSSRYQPRVFETRGMNEAILDGRISLLELNERLSLTLDGAEAHTVGGYIQDKLGRLAVANDEVETEEATLKVLSVTGRRISRVLVAKKLDTETIIGD